ncbi:hypothetical protein ACFVAJ_18495 [Agromyces sp. NPDC057679]|uniref:hypothetical protein n=1 Tax=Agromyces sp. NPDC057679 TaxID=3346207 RepID=UPI003672D764
MSSPLWAAEQTMRGEPQHSRFLRSRTGMGMDTFQEPLEWSAAPLPEFDWAAPITPEMQMKIAELGDNDMRERLAAHPAIVQRAARELVIVARQETIEILRQNPEVPSEWLSFKQPRGAGKIRRANRAPVSRKGMQDA